MRLLVTGATGFLGSHLVEKLLAQPEEHTLRVLSRRPNRWATHPRVESVCGNILDVAVIDAAVAGVDGIFHLAGFVTREPGHTARLFELHITGTRNIGEAALRHGLPRVVVSSSAGTLTASRMPVIHNEDSPYAMEVTGEWPYFLSKTFQEKLALDFHACRGLPVIVVNPSLLLGPGDERVSSTGDVLLFLKGEIPTVPTGGFNFVDVRDAADAIIRAMQTGAPGRRYLIGGHNVTVKEFFRLLERVSGVKAPSIELPESWARPGASAMRSLYRILHRPYRLDDQSLEMAYRFWYLDNSRAKSELQLNPRPAEETLRDTVEYLRGACVATLARTRNSS